LRILENSLSSRPPIPSPKKLDMTVLFLNSEDYNKFVSQDPERIGNLSKSWDLPPDSGIQCWIRQPVTPGFSGVLTRRVAWN